MSRPYLHLILLLPILALPHFSISQTIRDSNSRLMVKISNGEIRDSNSRKPGSISGAFVVRNNSGKKLGTIQNGKVANENAATIFKYDVSGTVRDKNGRVIYRIGNRDIKNSFGKLIMIFERIALIHIIGYLCFFR